MIVTNSGKVIIFSQDGTTPDRSVVKTNIADVKGIFIPGAAVAGNVTNPSLPYNRQSRTIVEISLNEGEKIQFDAQDVSTPSGWNLGTQASLNTAVNAILGYL